ncbi:ABC transporter permease [Thiohalorhabdus methylotrophus]|uniref:Transport permease protein n=1 Tax=Thiohalorhabdus methylotrophus TaxID=3242694 RepID=A0ABV4TSR9_9GAMM
MKRGSIGVAVPRPPFLAVWARNLRVWRRFAIPSLLGNFGEPLLYLLGLGYGLGRFISGMSEIPYLVYLASGILCATAMNTASYEGLYAAFTRMTRQDTYGAMLATPLRVEEVVAGEVAWCATKSLISGTTLFVVALFLGAVPPEPEILAALPVVFLIGLVFGALAMVVTSLAPSYDFFLYYFTIFITPMFMFSGVFYPIDTLPGWLRTGMQFLPLVHGVELVRPMLTGAMPREVPLHLGVLVLYLFGAYQVAVAQLRRRLLV